MLKKIVLYISAFLPMLTIMWVKECLLVVEEIFEKKAVWAELYFNPYLIIEILLIASVSVVLYVLLKRNKKVATKRVKIQALKNRTAEYYLEYFSLFVLALIGFSLTDIADIIVLVLLLVVLGVVYIKNDLYFMNPTINIFRSYIYEIEYSVNNETVGKLVISKDKLKNAQIVEIEVSEFEFTFVRKKDEQNDKTKN